MTHFLIQGGCHRGAVRYALLASATLDGGKHPGHPADKECHTHVGSKAEWERICDGLPQYPEASPDEIITTIQRKPGA
jgi:hypothetical protein